MTSSKTPGLAGPLISFRPYQQPVFLDRTSGIQILHWSRQIGKSFTLASWAVDRLLDKLQNNSTWLITVLSNSRDNGGEFALKCGEICRKLDVLFESDDQSPDLAYENMRFEIRINLNGKVGRIKVLSASPRTARGFSGDLILDEFAFHEDSSALWEAAEPILSSNPEYVCRIASTGNGKHNMFYRMVTSGQFAVSRISRTEAHRQGVKVYDPNTRQPITPELARLKSLDKRAYDQNYELAFNDENMALLTADLISAAERSLITIDEQTWTGPSIARMFRAEGELFAGLDIGRNRDISVITVLERIGTTKRVVGMLRMAGMRLPDQQRQIDPLITLPKFRKLCGDMTGLGLGLIEYAQEKHGHQRIVGINFSSTEPTSARILQEGRKAETAKVTEIMATDLLGCFEDRCIEIPVDEELRADLRKPEKITSPGGRVSIAASRDEAGHADHFWSIALANRASITLEVAGTIKPFAGTKRGKSLATRRERMVVG
jgi:phage FluMu gp28-like protein